METSARMRKEFLKRDPGEGTPTLFGSQTSTTKLFKCENISFLLARSDKRKPAQPPMQYRGLHDSTGVFRYYKYINNYLYWGTLYKEHNIDKYDTATMLDWVETKTASTAYGFGGCCTLRKPTVQVVCKGLHPRRRRRPCACLSWAS